MIVLLLFGYQIGRIFFKSFLVDWLTEKKGVYSIPQPEAGLLASGLWSHEQHKHENNHEHGLDTYGKKFSQYQKTNDLFMRDLASLAGVREQALDRTEKAVGQSREMIVKNQQAIYTRLDVVTQRQEKIFSYIASYIDTKGK